MIRILLAILILIACVSCVPEKSDVVQLGRGNWDTGHFQSEIVRLLLMEMGFAVEIVGELSPDVFYTSLQSGRELDLWVNGWFPLHEQFLQNDHVGKIERVGDLLSGEALEGYVMDTRTAREFSISSLDDLRDPNLARVFDRNGNGKADLVGCNPGWACERSIEKHLDSLRLTATVEQIQGEYSLLMADIVALHRRQEPIIYYTWTPSWTAAVLPIGEDLQWLSIDSGNDTSGASVERCSHHPCNLGFSGNTAQAVARADFLQNRPQVRRLLEVIRIPVTDVAEQNALMHTGQDADSDIEAHARAWIDSNRDCVDNWLAQASL